MKPIITSLLDIDFYKFTMGQLIFNKHRDTQVRFAFQNRTKSINLASVINEDDLRNELNAAKYGLHMNNSELHYLRGTNEYGDRMFSEGYLQFLERLELPSFHLEFNSKGFTLEFEGPWSRATYWETIALSIINELYNRAITGRMSSFKRDALRACGIKRLEDKISVLLAEPGVTFADFGTRRRFSGEWHDYVVGVLAKELPKKQFLGTSNTYLAMKHGLLPMGTSAHELFMVAAGLGKSDKEVRNSQNEVIGEWWQQYGYNLSIVLTDTFGSDFFFDNTQAHDWKGLRQDSGDPFEFGEKAIEFYKSHSIDPTGKIIIFSDGLDVETILKLYKHFKGRIKTSFGWGTNLTNDLGLQPCSMVVKAVWAEGQYLVKLSDNLSKATGRHEDIERMKKIFGYTRNCYEPCKY